MSDRILRFPDVRAASGMSRSTIYARINAGLFPRPILLGPRMVGWRQSEIVAMNAARVRGADDVEIRALVGELQTSRRSVA